jgi:hypothetical protein
VKHRPWIVALALTAHALAARAQHDPALVEAPTELAPPPLPPTPPELAAAVASLRADVASTAECYTAGGRMEHEADPACPRWYARIARSGPAAVFAIGELFVPASGPDSAGPMIEPIRDNNSELGRGPRLIQMMASTGRAEAVPFLLSYLVRGALDTGLYSSETDLAALAALRTLTGDDPAPTVPWEDDGAHQESPLARRETAQRWTAWLRESQGRTVAEWRAAGLARARQRLTSDDIAERYSAIRRLSPLPAERAAVVASLRGLLAREDLPAAGRMHLSRLARQRGLPLPARPLVAAR